MCFILCICCNLCNSYSSKCVEITILILSAVSFTSSIIGLLFVNEKHASKVGDGCLWVVISLSCISMLSIILILVWRFNSTINNKRNSAGSSFSKLGLVITIFMLLFTGIWESMTTTNFYSLNHPCQSIKRSDIKKENKTNLINLLLRRNIRNLLTYEENKEEFCFENPDYYIDVVSTEEYIYLFASATIIEVIVLILLYFWYNDFRRIKYLVDGQLIDSNTKENKINYDKKRNKFNNNFNYNVYDQNNYGAHYDVFGRPIFNVRKLKTKEIKVSNNNNTKKNINTNIPNLKSKSIEKKNRNSILGLGEKDKNRIREKEGEKILYNSNNNNNNNISSSDRMDIFNLKNSKNNFSVAKNNNNNNNDVLNLNFSKNSSKTNVIPENSFNNNDK